MTDPAPFPSLLPWQTELLHREVTRRLVFAREQYARANEGEWTPGKGTESTYAYASECTLRDVLGLLDACMDYARREAAPWRPAADLGNPRDYGLNPDGTPDLGRAEG